MNRVWAIVVVCCALLSCDETRVRSGASELATLENDAIRVLVSSVGIGRLVEAANAEGFPLTAPSLDLDIEDVVASIGPLEQVLGVSSRTSIPGDDSVSLTTRLDGPTVFVPMRIVGEGETRICRWRLDATRIETTASLVLVDGDGVQTFGVEDTPTVVIDSAMVVSVNDCSDLVDILPDNLDVVIEAYVSAAVASSAAQSLPSSPLDILGLLRGNTQLTRISPFPNRVGTLVIEAAVSPRADALAISPDGLTISLDATAEAQRARCAPPIAIGPTEAGGAKPLEADVVRRFGADFALAISKTWLHRIAQGSTLAGYACRGLEDARLPEVNEEIVPTEDVLLEELGLGTVPIGPFSTLVLSPGTLPEIDLRPDRGTIRATWNDIQVEVYGDVLGARTRVARVVADAVFGLRPRVGSVGATQFDMESIEVTTDRVDSEFFLEPPFNEDVNRWMQRTLLLMLEERFEFPLPIAPASPVRVVSVQVRDDDVVAFMRFD